LGEQVVELPGAHPNVRAEVISEHDALPGRRGFIDEQLRAPATSLTAESGERLRCTDIEHGEPPVVVA
jgi:hypothetical protein